MHRHQTGAGPDHHRHPTAARHTSVPASKLCPGVERRAVRTRWCDPHVARRVELDHVELRIRRSRQVRATAPGRGQRFEVRRIGGGAPRCRRGEAALLDHVGLERGLEGPGVGLAGRNLRGRRLGDGDGGRRRGGGRRRMRGGRRGRRRRGRAAGRDRDQQGHGAEHGSGGRQSCAATARLPRARLASAGRHAPIGASVTCCCPRSRAANAPPRRCTPRPSPAPRPWCAAPTSQDR